MSVPYIVQQGETTRYAADVLGGKGCGLMRISGYVCVPSFFVITTAVHRRVMELPLDEAHSWLNDPVMMLVRGAIYDCRFPKGRGVSVRSGAAVSMPGMMDTVLDVPVGGSEVLSAIWQVYQSYDSDRARAYRRYWGLPDDMGTAVIIQQMVYGDKDEKSGTGVVFTRNPVTGDQELYGEWLPQAKGDDLVGGKRTPEPLKTLEATMPGAYSLLKQYCMVIESLFGCPQDIEFTIESGKLYILQTRAMKVQSDSANETTSSKALLAFNGLGASKGVAEGVAVFDSSEAEHRGASEPVVLVRPDTDVNDVEGMIASKAIVTEKGGATCHAAIVARSLGKPAVVGCKGVLQQVVPGMRLRVDGAKGLVEVVALRKS